MKRPVVLLFVGYYLPGFLGGGPITTIANIVHRLGDEFHFKIITSDRDLGSADPYEDVSIDQWNTIGKASVFYASKKSRHFISILNLINKTHADIYYFNSFFSWEFSLKPILAKKISAKSAWPVILAPRGEFSQGALNIKPIKKLIYISVLRFFRVLKNVMWHASTIYEEQDIRRAMDKNENKCSVSIAADLVNLDMSLIQVSENTLKTDDLNICFLSRISPKKNLLFALKLIQEMSIPINFSIYGPKESIEYWDQCNEILQKMPANVKVSYKGVVKPENVKLEVSMHDVFFVPTLGENYGHVFFEALHAGVPLLISDLTPWRNLEAHGVGWDLPLADSSAFKVALNRLYELKHEGLQKMRKACTRYAIEHANNGQIIIDNKSIFSQLLSNFSSRPAS